jgi:7-cyano-7-deazaguanine synthase
VISQLQSTKHIGLLHQDKTAILLSGGMDSIALCFWKNPAVAFTINYGQKPAKAEIHAACQVAKYLNIEHHIIELDCSEFGSGDMSGNKPLSLAPATEWWPYRNQLLVTLACMKGINLGITELYIGSVKTDSTHSDGTKSFYQKISDLISYQEGKIIVGAPAIELETVDLIKKSGVPTSVLLWAHSCHTSNEPCMNCNGCKKYLHTLQQLGLD